jgi:hypothetical protein
VVKLSEEHDVDTLRQISLLLDRENQRLITKNLELTAELARLRGIPDVEQLTSRSSTIFSSAHADFSASGRRPGAERASPAAGPRPA